MMRTSHANHQQPTEYYTFQLMEPSVSTIFLLHSSN
ncbi:hypothetical protein SOVF_096950 [Spinacia oleracea]|nr:hypothetical protein SOVF_096950 [Spinacia oleracea]